MAIIIASLMGAYLVIDALSRLIKFWRQPIFYQVVTVGRGIIGLCLIAYPLTFRI